MSKQGSRKSSKLPSFGFAADLLKDAPKTTGDPRTGDPRIGDLVSAPPPMAAPPLPPQLARGPERLFSFADSLRASGEEEAVVAQQIETWVTFSLAGEIFALPVEPIREVLRVTGITRVPHAPHPIRGVANLRGRVIPVVDLRQRIELPTAEVDRSSRILVVSSRGRLIGLLVDAVLQVIHLDFLRVQPPPPDVVTAESGYVLGVYQAHGQLILLLDADRVLILQEAGAV